MQKYIFNSQGKNMRLQNNEIRVNDIVEQIVVLRTDQLELRQELAKLDKEMQALFDNLNANIKDLASKINLSSYNKKIIDVIINDFENDKNLVKENRQEFVDSKQLALEEKSYNNIINLLKDKQFKEGKLALKRFLIDNPNSSLNSII